MHKVTLPTCEPSSENNIIFLKPGVLAAKANIYSWLVQAIKLSIFSPAIRGILTPFISLIGTPWVYTVAINLFWLILFFAWSTIFGK